MRILHALHAFPPESRGGSENYVEALARAQQRAHEVLVVHRVSDRALPEYHVAWGEHEGLRVVRVNRRFSDSRRFRDGYRSRALDDRFGQILDRWRPAIVHFHHLSGLSTGCVDEAQARSIPVALTLHDFWMLCARGQLLRRDLSLCPQHTEADCVRCVEPATRRGPWRARLEATLRRARRRSSTPTTEAEITERDAHMRDLAERVDAFVSPSRFVADRCAAFGFPRERIRVVPNGFDSSAWKDTEAPKPLTRAAGAPLRVAYLGTWIPSKGVHLLIDAVRALDPAQIRLELHGYAQPFDGHPDYEGRLRSLARGAPHIRFGGRYAPAHVPALLRDVDLLAVPSLWYENAPVTLQEAFAAGIPVLAPRHGGILEQVVEGENGVLFEPGDVGSLRAALRSLLHEPAALGRLAGTRTPVPAIGPHAEELVSLYRALRGGGPAPSRGRAARRSHRTGSG